MIIINQNAWFLIFMDSVKKKMLAYENKMNLSSNYMLLTRKVIGVNGNVYIRTLRRKSHHQKCDKDIMSQFLVMTLSFLRFAVVLKAYVVTEAFKLYGQG